MNALTRAVSRLKAVELSRAGFSPTVAPAPSEEPTATAVLVRTIGTVANTASLRKIPSSTPIGSRSTRAVSCVSRRPKDRVNAGSPPSVRMPACVAERTGSSRTPSVSKVKSTPSGSSDPSPTRENRRPNSSKLAVAVTRTVPGGAIVASLPSPSTPCACRAAGRISTSRRIIGRIARRLVRVHATSMKRADVRLCVPALSTKFRL